jgi:hypothetical protein
MKVCPFCSADVVDDDLVRCWTGAGPFSDLRCSGCRQRWGFQPVDSQSMPPPVREITHLQPRPRPQVERPRPRLAEDEPLFKE